MGEGRKHRVNASTSCLKPLVLREAEDWEHKCWLPEKMLPEGRQISLVGGTQTHQILEAAGVPSELQLPGRKRTSLREDHPVSISSSLEACALAGRFSLDPRARECSWLDSSAPARAPDALCVAGDQMLLTPLPPSLSSSYHSLKKQLPTDPRSQEDSCWVVISFTGFSLSRLLPQ